MPGRRYRALREIEQALAPPAVPERHDDDVGPLLAFVLANPDPDTWTNPQLRLALIRLIRMELRRRGLYEEPVP